MENLSEISQVAGCAVVVRGGDIDTDRIIPARYLRTVTFENLGEHAFEDDRAGGDHPFDQECFQGAAVLLANANFGCGSSREHAVWAIQQMGVDAVISASFADIFRNNCYQNGLLPVSLSETEVETIMARAQEIEGYELTVNLRSQEVHDSLGLAARFEIDPFRKDTLLRGLDDIGLTMELAADIDTFENTRT